MAAIRTIRSAIDPRRRAAGPEHGRRHACPHGTRLRARPHGKRGGESGGRTGALAAALALALALAAPAARAGHHATRGPGFELVFNDREIVRIPRAYNPYESERDPANFFAFVALQNRAYQWVRATQDSLNWRWHLCQLNPDPGESVFRWPDGRDFAVELEDGRVLRAIEIVAYETCHSIPEEYEEPRMIRIHPRGEIVRYDQFTTFFPGSEAHVLLVAFDADAGRKWKVARVMLAGEAQDAGAPGDFSER